MECAIRSDRNQPNAENYLCDGVSVHPIFDGLRMIHDSRRDMNTRDACSVPHVLDRQVARGHTLEGPVLDLINYAMRAQLGVTQAPFERTKPFGVTIGESNPVASRSQISPGIHISDLRPRDVSQPMIANLPLVAHFTAMLAGYVNT